VANQTHEVEVIPYEELWEMILPLLRKWNDAIMQIRTFLWGSIKTNVG
jgi:hypothetical protein